MFIEQHFVPSGPLAVWATGAGPCDVLLLHSLGADGPTFAPMCESLAGVTCWAPDLWGHGRTPSRSAVDLDAIAHDLDALLDEHTPAVILGVSFGGVVAQLVAALRSPATALVLCNTFARWPGASERLEAHERAFATYPDEATWRRERGGKVLVDDAPEAARAAAQAAALHVSWAAFSAAAAAVYAADVSSVWTSLNCGRAVVTGEIESRIPHAVTADLVALAGVDEPTVIAGADHLCYLDRPETTARVLHELLR